VSPRGGSQLTGEGRLRIAPPALLAQMVEGVAMGDRRDPSQGRPPGRVETV
jgi:hypothetical protein